MTKDKLDKIGKISGIVVILAFGVTAVWANLQRVSADRETEIASKKWGAASDELKRLALQQQAEVVEARKDRKEFYRRNSLP